MKKQILIIAFSLAAFFCQAQKKDTLWTPTDSTEFISIKDMNLLIQKVGDKITMNDGKKMQEFFQLLINEAIDRKRKK